MRIPTPQIPLVTRDPQQAAEVYLQHYAQSTLPFLKDVTRTINENDAEASSERMRQWLCAGLS